jgi:hypothetical protein
MKANGSKSINVTFTTGKETWPPPGPYKQCTTPQRRRCQLSRVVPWKETYLAITHFRKIETTRNLPSPKCIGYWDTSQNYLQATNFLKKSRKPIWTYEIQLWGTAPTSNIEILKRFHSKILRMIGDALLYVTNTVIRRDLQKKKSVAKASLLSAHQSDLMELQDNRRLRRHCQIICLLDS